MNIPRTSFARIVIIGGGFAGISLAKKLSKQEVQVVLLDKHNYHTFQPLLYQVSTGGLEPDSIAYPIRKILKDFPNFHFRLALVEAVKPLTNDVITDIGILKFDYLVIASGSKTNYFGNSEIEKHSMAMKTIPQSLNLRSLILENFEEALLTNNLKERNALMNFVIVGAGPTGVELAGALAEIKKGILPKDYPDLDTRSVQINLIQSSDRILKEMSENASKKAEVFLEKLGVNIWKNVRVTSYDGKTVTTSSDLTFETATLIWAAGVKGATIKGLDVGDFITKGERILVNEFNQVKGFKHVFAIGDVACMESEEFPNGFPMMAQPAIQQGKQLGDNLLRWIEQKPMKPFIYKDKGAMATIGRNKAVVDLKHFKFQGIFAWYVWMFVHLFFLIGFRNRVVVFINWVYNYIRFDREARLIIRPFKRRLKR
ncbi:MAG: NAD(P)/FAD-dependent oxidoreductase [Flavobacteriales bacterium]|nr:NAD(P)/FAD-dependent oxidoreductase [Flavobacteriia bacterium]NCP06326.1 NAD(P)/FAD-dependent oxidoreductase [Flavobacteriales bacterium]PIV94327.1 MAG: FAD-dependent oxidoreductase [Flavobacteriaceae bacterium CG17_big_fil_post_rev_8_21_14_2_50_33_15]PIY13245.1 MAG: FAD-dependent oxidoreductase [Flavobacteriaceae bacterium CG_4_10_14_3_um_filter_33_47]PJB18630.1 MAG: FAD-dependent oxidoreductase [Flavobacteriaceae bacterium CG_4_9_14_3_um_filter_33_16]